MTVIQHPPAQHPLGCGVSTEAWAEEGTPVESSISPNEA